MAQVKFWVLCCFALSAAPAAGAGNREINKWQSAIVGIGRSIADRDQSGSSWIVEYNSAFPSTDIGLVLAPSSYDSKASSLNVIAVCPPSSSATISTEGRDFAEFASNRGIEFAANASPPPNFLSGSLASAGANLTVDRSQSVSFSLNDILVKQIAESDAIDAINTPECMRRIQHRRAVFFVRGQYLMRLTMAQRREAIGSAGLGLGASNANLGFGIRWNRQLEWEIAQSKPRPWFRIVSRFQRSRDGSRFEVDQ